jgi:cytosine deaminase
MGLEGYGLEVGCNADPVIVQAADVIKVLRLQPLRLCVVTAGTVIFRTVPRIGELKLEGRPHRIDHPVRE